MPGFKVCVSTLYDVCTMTKSPNDAFLRMYPHWRAMHDYTLICRIFFSLLSSFPFVSLDNQFNTALFLSCLFSPTHFWSLYCLLAPPLLNCNTSHFTHRPVLSPSGSFNISVNFSETARCNILKERIFMIHAIWKNVYRKYLLNHSNYVLYLPQTSSETFLLLQNKTNREVISRKLMPSLIKIFSNMIRLHFNKRYPPSWYQNLRHIWVHTSSYLCNSYG